MQFDYRTIDYSRTICNMDYMDYMDYTDYMDYGTEINSSTMDCSVANTGPSPW